MLQRLLMGIVWISEIDCLDKVHPQNGWSDRAAGAHRRPGVVGPELPFGARTKFVAASPHHSIRHRSCRTLGADCRFCRSAGSRRVELSTSSRPVPVAVCSLAPLASGVDGMICFGRQCRSVSRLFRLYWPGPRQPSPFIMASNTWMAGIHSIDFTYAAEAQ